jgi:hypothetical protein
MGTVHKAIIPPAGATGQEEDASESGDSIPEFSLLLELFCVGCIMVRE